MKFSLLISFLMIIIMVSSVTACTEKSGGCQESIECCSRYCRDGECINYGDFRDDRTVRNPCKPNPCRRGEICTLQQVQCVRSPCPPLANCYGR